MNVAGNGRYLIDSEGKPFFYLADTAWNLFYQCTLGDAAEYLTNRAAKRFNVIMACLVREGGIRYAVNRHGERPFVDNDPARPAEAFFRRVDTYIDLAGARGLTMALLPTWGEYVGPLKWGGGPELFTPDNACAYGTFLGSRFAGREVVWVLGGDRDPESPQVMEIWRAMADGLRTGSKGSHLLTYHPMGGVGKSSSLWFHDEPWLDFNMLQTGVVWDGDNYATVLRDRERVPSKPVVDGEARYENSCEFFFKKPPCGRRISAHQVRKAACNAILSGAMGHTYGCRDVWSFHDPLRNVPPPARDVTTFWKEAMDFPGARHMGHLRAFFERYPWFKLVPETAGSLVKDGCGETGSYVPGAIADDRTFAVCYVPEHQAIGVAMNAVDAREVEAQWFDPRSGTYLEIGTFESVGVREFRPPAGGEPDYLLVLTAAKERA